MTIPISELKRLRTLLTKARESEKFRWSILDMSSMFEVDELLKKKIKRYEKR